MAVQSDAMGDGRPAWLERENNLEKVVKIGVFGVIVLVVIYPFLSVLATSLASEPDVIKNGGLVIWPEHPTFSAYQTIFAGGVVTRAMEVSIGITTVGTLLSLAVTIGMAYACRDRSGVASTSCSSRSSHCCSPRASSRTTWPSSSTGC